MNEIRITQDMYLMVGGTAAIGFGVDYGRLVIYKRSKFGGCTIRWWLS